MKNVSGQKHMQRLELFTLGKKRLQKTLANILQKTANESILKMAKNGHNAKAIAHAKYSLWVKK